MWKMKITLIAGSNRAGATSTNLLRYIESLLKAQQLSVEFVDLSELPHAYCKGRDNKLRAKKALFFHQYVTQ
jgi:NAD(P)H-dependent FMN reductase